MTDFILLLIFGAVWTWGFHCPFQDGYILEKAGHLMWDRLPKWISKPLFACPPCMASAHGFLISAFYYDWHIFQMLPYMICLCGLNYILKTILYPEYE